MAISTPSLVKMVGYVVGLFIYDRAFDALFGMTRILFYKHVYFEVQAMLRAVL